MGFGATGVGGFSAPGVTGGTPTIAGVLGFSRTQVAGGFGAVTGLAVPGFSAPFAQGGFYNASVAGLSAGVGGPGQAAQMLGFGGGGFGGGGTSIIEATGGFGDESPRGPTVVNIPQGRGRGLGGGVRPGFGGGSGFAGRGFGRLVGAGFLAHMGFGALEAERQFNIDMGMAGSDSRAQYEAIMAKRKGLMSDFGWIGAAVGYGQDPSGNEGLGIRATIEGADARDRQTGVMKSVGLSRQRAREEEGVSVMVNPEARRMEQIKATHEERKRQIQVEKDEAIKADREVYEKTKSQRLADQSKAVDEYYLAHRPVGEVQSMSQQNAARAAAETAVANQDQDYLASLRADSAQKMKGFDADFSRNDRMAGYAVRDLRREMALKDQQALLLAAGDIGVSNLVAANNPRAATRLAMENKITQDAINGFAAFENPLTIASRYAAGLAGLAALDAGDARELAGRRRELRGVAYEQAQEMDRNPLGVRLEGIDRAERRALADPDAVNDPEISSQIRSNALTERVLARRNDSEQRELRDTALANRGAELKILLRKDPYAGKAAESLSIKDEAFQRVQELELTNGGGRNNNAIKQLLTNAQTEQQVLAKQLIQTFAPQSVSINQTDLSGGGHGGNVQATLTDIAKNTADTAKKLDNVGKAL